MAYIVVDVNAGQKASWIPLAYVLAQGTPVPFAGYIQDIVGRRWMTLIASLAVAIGAFLLALLTASLTLFSVLHLQAPAAG
jgi:MFS family permease